MDGKGRLVLLSGRRGIGKTRMAMEFSTQARNRGAAVLRTSFAGDGRGQQSLPWAEILRRCAGSHEEPEIANTAGGLVEADEVASEFRDWLRAPAKAGDSGKVEVDVRLFDGVVSRIEMRARRAPLLVVLDDLQEADAPSLLFLQHLTRHLRELPVMLLAVGNEQDLEPGHPLAEALVELGREPTTERLEMHEEPAGEPAGLHDMIAPAFPREGRSTRPLVQEGVQPFAPPPQDDAQTAGGPPSTETVADRTLRAGVWVREGDFWTISLRGVAARFAESRGLFYLRQLLRHPRRPFFVLDLVDLAADGRRPDVTGTPDRFVPSSAAQPVLDAKARAACRERLGELREELADAELRNDLGRAQRARVEIDQLFSQWQRSVGLGERTRVTSSMTDRARSAVTRRLRTEIMKIAEAHPHLGHHLTVTIITGRVCSYEPDRDTAVVWNL